MEPRSDTIRINEIFFSIQGESLLVGKPTVFVRASHCNLRCKWCDTKYAYWQGTVMSVDEIVAKVEKHDTKYVCLTGGEPLGQTGIYPLMEVLLQRGYTVSLETSGSFSIDRVPEKVTKVVDVKCPGSGETEKMHWDNLKLVGPSDQLKFVVASREDFDWAQSICAQYELIEKCHVLYSPVFESVSPRDLAEWILAAEAKVTMQVQLHKTIWGPNERGV